MEIKACLELECFKGISVACGVNRWYKLEFVAKGSLICEQAPFEEPLGLGKLTLQSQIVCNEYK